MAITAVRIFPLGPEILPDAGGLVREIWRLTGDGSATSIAITPDIVRKIYFVNGNGATNGLSSTPGQVASSVTFTFATAPGNGLKLDVEIDGKV